MINKLCSRCNTVKLISEFGNHRGVKNGRSVCKDCTKALNLEYAHSKIGLITKIYHHQVQSSKHRGMALPTYSKQELIDWVMNEDKFSVLYDAWCESGYTKALRPSVDRKDDHIGYTIDNIQLMTWQENELKGNESIKSGENRKYLKEVHQFDAKGNFIRSFYSIAEAARKTGTLASNISQCCNNIRCESNNFMWSFNKDGIFKENTHRKRIAQLSKELVLQKEFDSIKQAKIETGIDDSSITKCCKGKAKTAGGFVWKYI